MQSFSPASHLALKLNLTLSNRGWKKHAKQCPTLILLFTSVLLAGIQPLAVAQIAPDNTLPDRSVHRRNGRFHEITGGTTRNRNLFHSFEQFSVPTGSTALFNNNTKIENIFARVTGRSISQIDGLIRVNGSANLFLLNPNGIVFGPNAQLNIGGSFISSTADSIQFADGREFNAASPRSSSLLTISTPVGLQYGANPAPIRVNGDGHNLRLDQESLFILRDDRPAGLQVLPGQTLALLGGDLFLEGGNLTAAGGRIELGSLRSAGPLTLVPAAVGWQVNYPKNTDLGTIRLSQAASVDVSGEQGGRIQVEGRRVALTNGSTLIANTFGIGAGGNVQIRSTESVTLQGRASNTLTDNFPFPSSVLTEVRPGATGFGGNLSIGTVQLRVLQGAQISASTYGRGPSGNLRVDAQQIELAGEANGNPSGLFVTVNDVSVGNPGRLTVHADRLVVRDGAQISSSTFAPGNAGNLNITAQTIEIFGRGSQVPSGLFAATFGEGNGGQLTVKADRLEISNGAEISANTFSSGNAGNVRINVGEAILTGLPDFATGIFAQVQTEATGQGGDLEINAEQLRVLDGAAVSASTFGAGSSGNLLIRAQEVELAGFFELRRSGLFTSALIGSGMGGDLSVSTDRLVVRDGAMMGASNFHSIRQDILPGQGPAGNVQISAGSIRLDSEGIITASTREGGRGNISLQADSLVLSQNSRIIANSEGKEPGGNINLDLTFLAAQGNSDITANAVNAQGGQINVTTQALFGTVVRDRTTDESDITTSSELGAAFSGNISLNTPDVNPTQGLVELPLDVIQATDQIAATCEESGQNTFVATGRGGLPDNPTQALRAATVWDDLSLAGEEIQDGRIGDRPRHNVENTTQSRSRVDDAQVRMASTVVEAQAWLTDRQGKIRLVAQGPTAITPEFQEQASRCSHTKG